MFNGGVGEWVVDGPWTRALEGAYPECNKPHVTAAVPSFGTSSAEPEDAQDVARVRTIQLHDPKHAIGTWNTPAACTWLAILSSDTPLVSGMNKNTITTPIIMTTQ